MSLGSGTGTALAVDSTVGKGAALIDKPKAERIRRRALTEFER